MNKSNIILFLFSFTAVFIAHFFEVLCESAANAINANKVISTELRSHFKLILQTYGKRIIIPLIFFIIVLIFYKLNIFERLGFSIFFGFCLLFAINYKDIFPTPNVVPLSWSIIYGGAFSIIFYSSRFQGIIHSDTLSIEFFKVSLQIIIVVGTILGVSMTILWTMNPKNLQGLIFDQTNNINYIQINVFRGLWALYMLTLFLSIFLGISIWMVAPLVRSLEI